MESGVIIRQHYFGIDADVEYLFTIYGDIPEIGPVADFRRAGARVCTLQGEPERKEIKCPYCAARLTDTNISTKVEIIKRTKAKPLISDLYMKCCACKKESGVKIIKVA